MIQQIIDIAIPVTTFILMCIIGMELTVTDFRRVFRYPGLIIAAMLGQIFVLPLCAIALVYFLDPPSGLVVGMLLLAACPGGALSNLYVYILRGNVALSVTLTALTTVLAVSYTPVVGIWALGWFGHYAARLELPIVQITWQLCLFILLPVALGMAIRAWNPWLVEKSRLHMQILSIAGIATIVGLIFWRQQDHLLENLITVAPFAIGFSSAAMFIGYITGQMVRAEFQDRIVLMIEFGVRNIPVTILLASNFADKAEANLFAATYFVIHAPVIIVTTCLLSRFSGTVPVSK